VLFCVFCVLCLIVVLLPPGKTHLQCNEIIVIIIYNILYCTILF
jgi:hypothetical protein